MSTDMEAASNLHHGAYGDYMESQFESYQALNREFRS